MTERRRVFLTALVVGAVSSVAPTPLFRAAHAQEITSELSKTSSEWLDKITAVLGDTPQDQFGFLGDLVADYTHGRDSFLKVYSQNYPDYAETFYNLVRDIFQDREYL